MKIRKIFGIIRKEGVICFLKKSLFFAIEKMKDGIVFLFFPYFVSRIEKFSFQSLDELVDFAFGFPLGIIRPLQISEEITKLLEIVRNKQSEVVLEIGTASGGTLFLISQVVSEDAVIISVDLPGGEFGGGYPEWKSSLYQSFTQKNQTLHLIRSNSHKQETLTEVKNVLGNQAVDFLFIDGDHSYQGVKKDFKMYLDLLDEEGFVGLHDICKNPKDSNVGVPKFWREIKADFSTKEIIYDKKQRWAGIGVIYL